MFGAMVHFEFVFPAMANLMSDFSNEIYDAQAALGDVNLVKSHGVCPYTVFLGVFVSLIPKVNKAGHALCWSVVSS